MLFKRRNPLHWLHRLADFFWPRIGFKRSSRYIMLRLQRLPASSHAIALGLAIGGAVSFTPFVGFHIAFAVALTWLFRGNVLSAALGTIVGNPWTFPLIWLSVFHTGSWFLNANGQLIAGEIDFIVLFQDLTISVLQGDLALFTQKIWPVFLPMLLGGALFFPIIFALMYFPLRRLIHRYKEAHMEKRLLRKKKHLERLERKKHKVEEKIEKMGEQVQRIEEEIQHDVEEIHHEEEEIQHAHEKEEQGNPL